MKQWIVSIYLIFYASWNVVAQTPQNVTVGEGRGESIWDSTATILAVIGFLLLIIISRKWSKKIHEKRDELARRDSEDKAPSDENK